MFLAALLVYNFPLSEVIMTKRGNYENSVEKCYVRLLATIV